MCGKHNEMVSFGERRAMRYVKDDPPCLLRHNFRQMTRIYPTGARFDSSNFDPLPFWNAGCQLGQLSQGRTNEFFIDRAGSSPLFLPFSSLLSLPTFPTSLPFPSPSLVPGFQRSVSVAVAVSIKTVSVQAVYAVAAGACARQ